jgi:hypothetical protein
VADQAYQRGRAGTRRTPCKVAREEIEWCFSTGNGTAAPPPPRDALTSGRRVVRYRSDRVMHRRSRARRSAFRVARAGRDRCRRDPRDSGWLSCIRGAW